MERKTEKRERLVDLHFHSVYSDGSEKIPAIIEEAKKNNVMALALTDHNNGNGVPEFMAACKEAGISALEGTEIYASFAEQVWSWDDRFCGPVPDVTIIGKKLDWEVFKKYQKKLFDYQLNFWLPKTLHGLRRAGMLVPSVTHEETEQQLKKSFVPHILHDVPKDWRNFDRLWEICYAFDSKVDPDEVALNPVRFANQYLYGPGKQAYVLRAPQDWTVKCAAELAEEMGGLLFAAHPGDNFRYKFWSDEHLEYFVQQGGRGIEVYQYFHSESQMQRFYTFAREHGLLISGGSDWHGKNGRPTLGCWDKPVVQTPFEVYERLIEQLP